MNKKWWAAILLVALILFIVKTKIGYMGSTTPQNEFSCEGQPEICAQVYSPVCGSDGETYPNACMACSEDVDYYALGECAKGYEKWISLNSLVLLSLIVLMACILYKKRDRK